ncbi:MAG TPA: VapE domain-containing protein [Bryobacteraceae bacterium]|nr:VapE domain-containing protein [Bryobacteraceae bacterium]
MIAADSVRDYYRRVTEVEVGEIARELLAGRITQASDRTLQCNCPNHQSQSRRSLHIMLDKQGWYCFGCGVGGDVLQLVEFVHSGQVTRGLSGQMPESHRQARDFLAARAGMPPLAGVGLSPDTLAALEEERRLTLRVHEALTALADRYHEQLVQSPEVLAWCRRKYGISDDMIARLRIGYAENGSRTDADGTEHPSIVKSLLGGADPFSVRELAATSAFRPTPQDGVVPFFDRRIVFPYWGRGHVVFMIGRQTPWTPDTDWEKSKYKKLAVRNDRNHGHVAQCIRNDVLYNEDALAARPERVVITEGVTDCISLMERGFAAVSPVTVQIREADWERLLPKIVGVKTVFICQDNEVSDAGMAGALRTAGVLARHGILTRIAVLPLGAKQANARRELRERFGVDGRIGPKELAKALEGRTEDEVRYAEGLLADAKIDVNEYFAAGATAADFEAILAAAKTPLELAISKLSPDTPDGELARVLEPILAEIGRLDPIEETRHLRLIQEQCGKRRLPVAILRKQMKVVRIDGKSDARRPVTAGDIRRGPITAAALATAENWRNELLLNLNGTVKPVLANAMIALRGAAQWDGVLAFNEFSVATVAVRPAPWMLPDTKLPHIWTGTDDILAAEWLQREGVFVSPDAAAQAVEVIAKNRCVHPVREYLQALTWDGTPRLRHWLVTYLGVEPSPYVHAVSISWPISAVARILSPGVKADTCLILEGPQGIKKSTALRVLSEPWFTDEIAELGSKDAALQMRGVWVIEIAELDSLSRTEVSRVKGFMSQLSDRFRPPYGERLVDSPRQCVFAGTVNHSAYLRDETGGRRFWPVECKAAMIDVDGLAAARNQLWAEAVAQYLDGKPWWLESMDLNQQAAQEQANRYEGDPWDDIITRWVAGRETVSITEIFDNCLEKRKDMWTQGDRNRVARCLRALGWVRFRAGGRTAREWRYRCPSPTGAEDRPW